jgi:hypothetical protein
MKKLSAFARIVRVVLGLIVAPVVLTAAFAGPTWADVGRGLDGVWEGSLTVAQVGSPTTAKLETWSIRVEISGETARIWHKFRNDWDEFDRPLRVQRLRSNAVVTSIHSGRDEDGIWVETWSIALAQKNEETALAVFSRLVNNENLPPTSDDKAFSAASIGELKRSSR